MNEKADKSFGLKVTEKNHERAKMLMEASGLTGNEWFEKLLTMEEAKSLMDPSSEYSRDLTELEQHTTRIYELVVNMVNQSVYLRDAAVKEVRDKLISNEEIIAQLQGSLKDFKQKVNELTELTEKLTSDNQTLLNELEKQQQVIENNNLLINEYKEKNDTLSGLVSKYQSYSDENERLKSEFEMFKTNSEEQRKLIRDENTRFEQIIKELSSELNSTKKEFERDIEVSKERNELEVTKAILETERTYQQKLEVQSDKYNEKIEKLQVENERIRKEAEQKLQTENERIHKEAELKLQSEIAKLKNEYEAKLASVKKADK